MAITVITGEATNILNDRATLNGEYTIWGDTVILQLLFILGEPNIDWGANQDDITPVSPFEYTTYPNAQLRPNTYYEYKAWFKVKPHGSYPYTTHSGAVQNFTTAHLIVTTQAVTNINTTWVTANGTITDDCLEMERGFEYYKDGVPETLYYKWTIAGQEGAYSKSITGLLSNTKYYIRTYVRLKYWDRTEEEYTYYITTGDWVEFTTLSVNEVTTQAASSIGVDHAKGNGTSAGGDATERGFEIKLAFSGTLYEYIQHHAAGFSTGTVSYNLATTKWEGTITKTVSEEGTFVAESFTGDLGRFPTAVFSDKLFAGETYNYRARATIDGTVYYGDWVEFTTATYPAGGGPDDQIPIEDIIIEEPPPDIIPEEWPEWIIEWEEYPPFDLPEFDWPEFDYPEIPPYNGSWLGWFYYRKAYTKRDLEELRKKCRIFQDNSVEYALVLNHNSRVLQQFLNTMTTYMGANEHNTFRPIIPTQHLNELARKPLDVKDFKAMINNFISNSIDNANNVNNNFRLMRDGLNDYVYTEDEGFRDISITTRVVNDNNPDVDSLKKVIDRLNREMSGNYRVINHNLHVLRAILI